jgi:hypothetical protein
MLQKLNYIKQVNLIFSLPIFIFIMATGCRQVKKEAQSGTLNVKGGTAEITFNALEHNFGKITEGEKVACVFSFENTGSGDLVIASATTSCGCTVPEFDDKPIPPGGKGTMEVVFDSSGRSGIQTKTITVRSNAEKQVMILKITAEVITNTN